MSETANPLTARTFKEDRRAWQVLVALAIAAVAGGYWGLHRAAVPPPDPAAARSTDPRIVVLAYDRVSDRGKDAHLDPAVLRRHLESLRGEGFEPITLQEVAAFYYQGRPLPPKPVLLTFDFGYLDTYAAADPVLRAMGWRAVMFLVTSRQEDRNPAFIYWDRAQRMVDSGVWELGAQGHFSHDQIPTDVRGTQGSFLTDRMWLPAAGRAETREEFTARVRRDYEDSKRAIESNLRAYRVFACASRIGFSGAAGGRDVYQVNHEAMTAGFALGFVDDRFGVNDRFSDPHRLKRLRVDPSWSLESLMTRLHAALSDPSDTPPAEARFSAWVPGTGVARLEHGELVMQGAPRADAWLPGSQWARDWVLEAEVRTDGTELWIVQESVTPGVEWRWGGHDRATYLQRREWGVVSETLATFPGGIEPNTWHRLKLVKRGAGVWVEWDGRPLAERPAHLPGMWRGNVGVVGWRTGPAAHIRMARLTFSRFRSEIRPVSPNPSQEEVQALIREAVAIGAVSPVGAVVRGNDIHRVPFDRELLAILSHRYGWELIPTLRVTEVDETGVPGDAPADPGPWPEAVLGRVEREGWAGLRLDLTSLAPPARRAVESAVDHLGQRLGAQGRRFTVAESDRSEPPSSTAVHARR